MNIVKTFTPAEFKPVKGPSFTLSLTVTKTRLMLGKILIDQAIISNGSYIEILELDNQTLGLRSVGQNEAHFKVAKSGSNNLSVTNSKLCAHFIDYYKLTSAFENGVCKSHKFNLEVINFEDGKIVYSLIAPKSFK